MIYLDTSAFVKLIRGEEETSALQAFLRQRPGAPLVSSALLVVETRRAILRQAPGQLARADLLLTRIDQVDVTRAVLEAASRLPDPALRSLDAIHLATALQLDQDLEALVTYDSRLAAAAERQKLPVATP
ncbi:MAG TPA: type II toxin-antitoxin system VapC family toxin [Actinomycetota bacterium]|nr:type II toxin-antitoxin system VapC family toxin [Actinomycetota bacterium]